MRWEGEFSGGVKQNNKGFIYLCPVAGQQDLRPFDALMWSFFRFLESSVFDGIPGCKKEFRELVKKKAQLSHRHPCL